MFQHLAVCPPQAWGGQGKEGVVLGTLGVTEGPPSPGRLVWTAIHSAPAAAGQPYPR